MIVYSQAVAFRSSVKIKNALVFMISDSEMMMLVMWG